MNFAPMSQKLIPFNKGIQEEISGVELGSSELIDCVNYELTNGNTAGLRLVDGYEPYDGIPPLASTIPVDFHLDTGTIIQAGDTVACVGDTFTNSVAPSRCNVKFEDPGDGSLSPDGYTISHDSGLTPEYPLEYTLDKMDSQRGVPRFYWEFQVDALPTGVIGIGVRDETTGYRYTYRSNGDKYNGEVGTPSSFGATYTTGDVIGIFYYQGKIWFTKNGTLQGPGSPTNDYSPDFTLDIDAVAMPVFKVESGFVPGTPIEVTANTEGGSLVHYGTTGTFSGGLILMYVPCFTDESFTAEQDGDYNRLNLKGGIYKPTAIAYDDPILAVFEYAGKTWTIVALDNGSGDPTTFLHKLYSENEVLGWYDHGYVNNVDANGNYAMGSNSQPYMYYKGRIVNVYENKEIMIFCNGVSQPFLMYYDTDTGTLYQHNIGAGGLLPSDTSFFTAEGYNLFPTIPVIWNQRLILAYPEGNIFFNHPGYNPYSHTNGATGNINSWDPGVASAGSIHMEDEITNLLIAPSSCVIFCEHMIKAMKLSNPDLDTGVDFVMDTYSDKSGALWNTARRILGRILYCDDRGITTLQTTAAYGDFQANVISKNIQSTYDSVKNKIIAAEVNRERDQYKVYTNEGTGFTVTFKADRSLKGITKFVFPDSANCFYENKWMGGATGYVFRVNEDVEKFNQLPISGYFKTSYFTYNAPTNHKRFKRMLFELSAERGTQVWVRNQYNYNEIGSIKALEENLDTYEFYSEAIWNESTWGDFIWGGNADQNRDYIYSFGIGTNMSVKVRTLDMYHPPHVITSVLVNYSQGSMDF